MFSTTSIDPNPVGVFYYCINGSRRLPRHLRCLPRQPNSGIDSMLRVLGAVPSNTTGVTQHDLVRLIVP